MSGRCIKWGWIERTSCTSLPSLMSRVLSVTVGGNRVKRTIPENLQATTTIWHCVTSTTWRHSSFFYYLTLGALGAGLFTKSAPCCCVPALELAVEYSTDHLQAWSVTVLRITVFFWH